MSKLIKKMFEEFGIDTPNSTSLGFNSIENIDNKIEKAEKIEEVDTITFGLETDDGKIVKVYVKAEQADDFEEALSKELGKEDVIEDVLNKLSKDFDIIDVEWPEMPSDEDGNEDEDELSVDDVDLEDDEEEMTDGSESLNKTAWKQNSARDKAQHLVKKESMMTYGQMITKRILDDNQVNEGKRFVTVINGKEKVFGAFDEKAAQKLADRWGGDKVKPYQGHNKGGKKKVAEAVKMFNSIEDIVNEFGPKKIVAWLEGNGDSDVEEAILEYYMLGNEMPYGIQKARTGDPYNWIADHFPDDLAKMGYIDKNTQKWIAKEALNPSVLNQPYGRQYKVGLLDSRFSTQYQFMIYQALLDLGIPDMALFKAPQKNELILSIKNIAKELQKDPVRRQALKFLINRLKETADVNEAKKEDSLEGDTDNDGTVEDSEKKELEKLKVGSLDDRFTTVIQKLVYQTILLLGLPDEFMVKSAFKNTIINSIKNKAKDIQKDSVKRSALRIFTRRFADVNESIINELKVPSKLIKEDNINENAGSDAVEFAEFFIESFIPESKKDVFTNLKESSVWNATRRAINSNSKASSILVGIKQQLAKATEKMAAKSTATPFQEQLEMTNEANEPTEDTKKLIKYIQDSRRTVQADIKTESDATTRKHLQNAIEAMDKAEQNAQTGNLFRAAWYSLRVSAHMQKAINSSKLTEAKWGGEQLLDDPEDQEKDPDTKVKLPKRKKDKRVGEETEWVIEKIKKTGELKLECDEVTILLDDESTEKLIKAISNKSIVVVVDADESNTKWVFSPRGRTYMVKKAGSPIASKPLILSLDDVSGIEDTYLGK
jgi:hypothetical protein